MILEAFGGISPHSLHFRTGLEHEHGAPRSFFRITTRITTRSGSSELAAAAQVAGGRREGDRRKKITETKMRLIKDALKATGWG